MEKLNKMAGQAPYAGNVVFVTVNCDKCATPGARRRRRRVTGTQPMKTQLAHPYGPCIHAVGNPIENA